MIVSLDIFSDPICPWCLIGKARLDRAEEAAGRRAFARRWRPFQLNPDMPPEGVDRRAYLEAKFGGPDGAQMVYGRIEETAKADGLDVAFDKITRTPNTLDAHRLIKWAGEAGDLSDVETGFAGVRQDAVMNALLRLYFFEGADISDRDLLGEIAEHAGLDGAAMRRALDTDADREAVAAEDAEARSRGVSGAPTFVVAGAHVAPGAQSTALWSKVIEEIAPV